MTIEFTEMTDADLCTYEALIRPLMHSDDFITPAEHFDYKSKTDYRAWILTDADHPESWIGWCAVAAPALGRTEIGFYGVAVMPAYRGRGMGRSAYSFMLGLYGDRPCITHVRPQNIAGLNTALASGFVPIEFSEPWIILRHMPVGL